jgi:hypothetical protein
LDVGKVLLGIGLGFDVIGTLFISLDVLKGQRENLNSLNFVAYILGFTPTDNQGYTDALSEQALSIDPGGDPQIAEKQRQLKKLNDDWNLLISAQNTADIDNRKNFQDRLVNLRKGFDHRAPLIYAAIALVAAGGILEFIGGVFFGT